MTKCANCKETLFIQVHGFSGIPKKKFCPKCWARINIIWHAERYLKEDPKLAEWTRQIKIDEEYGQ